MIVPMKKVKLFFMEEDQDRVMKNLQAHALIMLDERHKKQINPSHDLISTSKALSVLEGFVKKASYGSNAVVSVSQFEKVNEDTKGVVQEVNAKYEEKLRIKAQLDEILKQEQQLKPYEPLDVPTNTFKRLKYFDVILGRLATEKLQGLLGSIQGLDVFTDQINEIDHTTYLSLVVLKEQKDQLLNLLDQVGFVRDTLGDFAQKNTFILKFYSEEVQNLSAKIAEIDAYFTETAKELGSLKLLYDQLQSKDMRTQISLLKTEQTVYLEGWMRSDELEKLDYILTKDEISYEIEARDPLPDELSPTALKNNKFVQSFETITNQFSVPNPKELDPNPLMSIWYWLIFGLMIGDMGYGLAMVIIFGYVAFFTKIKGGIKELSRIFFLTGISSIIAGALFGSLFGVTLYTPVFDPIYNPIPVLILSIALGVLHIICALVMKAIMGFRKGEWADTLASAISWILILVGVALLVVDMFEIMRIPYVGLILIGLGVALIIIFNGWSQSKWYQKGLSAFTGIYNVTSYLSDLLSYSRILALALSSAVIAMTMNTLAGLVGGNAWWGIIISIPIYLVGHVFNFVMGLLSAYVHAGRLQYLEYYGKFYEGGGYLFDPLRYNLTYVYNVTSDDKNVALENN